MTGIILCFVAGFLWSLFDVYRKLSLSEIEPISLVFILFFVQFIIFFFINITKVNPNSLQNINILLEILLIILTITSAYCFLKLLSLNELSLIIPILSFTPAINLLLSKYLINENLSATNLSGILLICIGGLVLYTNNTKFKSFINFKFIFTNKIFYGSIFVAFTWSLIPILDKICIKQIGIQNHGILQSFGCALLIFIFSYRNILKNLRYLKNKKIIFTAVIGSLATILQYFAVTLAYVAIMEAIKRGIGHLFSIIFGKVYFGETITKSKILAAFLMIPGVIFVLI